MRAECFLCKDAVALLSKNLLNLLGNGGHRAATAEEEVVAFTVSAWHIVASPVPTGNGRAQSGGRQAPGM